MFSQIIEEKIIQGSDSVADAVKYAAHWSVNEIKDCDAVTVTSK